MNSPRNIVGPVVRKLRMKKGLTQAALAAKLNILGWDLSRDTLAKIEAQIRWVADFEILDLAAALGTDGGDLLRMAASSTEKRPKPRP